MQVIFFKKNPAYGFFLNQFYDHLLTDTCQNGHIISRSESSKPTLRQISYHSSLPLISITHPPTKKGKEKKKRAKSKISLSLSLRESKTKIKRRSGWAKMSLRNSCLSRRISRSFGEAHKSSKETGLGAADDSVVSSTTSASMDSGAAAAHSSGSWAGLLPELLGEIIRRVETTEDSWPHRQNVVACACVCKRWREITKDIVKSPFLSGKITFPSCLKQVIL